jgi:uncharacterized protein YbcV (DUF1398 family)
MTTTYQCPHCKKYYRRRSGWDTRPNHEYVPRKKETIVAAVLSGKIEFRECHSCHGFRIGGVKRWRTVVPDKVRAYYKKQEESWELFREE